jgi:DNA replication protein DnaC
MKAVSHAVDEARLGIMLNDLRLPTIKTLWPQFAERADREGWPAARFLAAIAEHELAERSQRTWQKLTCRPERRSTASPSRRSR